MIFRMFSIYKGGGKIKKKRERNNGFGGLVKLKKKKNNGFGGLLEIKN